MKKRIRLWFLMILAWLYDHEWCARLGWVFSVLNYWSAKSGYSAAVKEMRKNVANDLRCGLRIANPELFGKPILYSYQGIFHEAWDAGYARAITLYQLAIDPDIDAASLRPLRDPTFCPQLDSIIQSCLHGMLQPPPTKLYNEYSLGIDKPQSDLQAALWEEYRRYAANIQQISARFSELYRETDREIPVFVEEPSTDMMYTTGEVQALIRSNPLWYAVFTEGATATIMEHEDMALLFFPHLKPFVTSQICTYKISELLNTTPVVPPPERNDWIIIRKTRR